MSEDVLLHVVCDHLVLGVEVFVRRGQVEVMRGKWHEVSGALDREFFRNEFVVDRVALDIYEGDHFSHEL